jgi:hypothetical protein
MSLTTTINKQVTAVNGNFSTVVSQNSSTGTPFDVDLAAAKIGVLTTRTNNTDGSLTMNAGHGITTGARLDIYWTVGGVSGIARAATVGTVATNVVPFTGATGDVLPAAASAITAMVPTRLDVQLNGTNAVGILLQCDNGGMFVFATTVPAEIFSKGFYPLVPTNVQTYSWLSVEGATNPLTGQTVRYCYISHGDSTATRKLKGLVQFN